MKDKKAQSVMEKDPLAAIALMGVGMTLIQVMFSPKAKQLRFVKSLRTLADQIERWANGDRSAFRMEGTDDLFKTLGRNVQE